MDRLLTLKETGKLLNVSKQTLQRWDNSGKLIAVRTKGGHRRYKLSDIEKIFKREKVKEVLLSFRRSLQNVGSECNECSMTTFDYV